MKEDIFTIIKNGYVPTSNLIEYAMTKGYDFDGFDKDCNQYTYLAPIDLLWDGDGYNIICYIDEPEIEEDETTVMVRFYCDLILNDEEKRNLPIFVNLQEEHSIKTCEQFIDVLDSWQNFVGESYIKIISHRLAILNELDNIVQRDKEVIKTRLTKKTIKSHYKQMMTKISDQLLTKVDDIINFKCIIEDDDDYIWNQLNDMGLGIFIDN